MKFSKFFLLPLAFILASCASKATVADLARVEATANEALNLAKTDSAQIHAMSLYLEILEKRIDLLDSISTALPIAKSSENMLQLALLREEVTFLRRFMENQDKVPLINPSREQLPANPGPLPEEYQKAQYLFTQKNYEAAAKQFEKVTVLYPKSDWADDAWYWVGESQMELGNYAQAIAAFEKVFF
jgi:TolA-binding protein